MLMEDEMCVWKGERLRRAPKLGFHASVMKTRQKRRLPQNQVLVRMWGNEQSCEAGGNAKGKAQVLFQR